MPDLNEMLKPTWKHMAGTGLISEEVRKKDIKKQYN